MPPRHVRSYSDFYRHGRQTRSVLPVRRKSTRQKIRHSSDNVAILTVGKKRSKSKPSFSWRRIKNWTLGVTIAGWLLLPLYLPYFRVQNIVFENFPSDLEMPARSMIRDTITPSFFLIPRNNYFLVKADEIKTTLADRLKTIENITVVKKFPHQLVISATEKSPAVFYDDGHSYFTLDAEGNVLHELATIEENEFTFTSHKATPSASSATSATSTLDNSTTDNASVRIHIPDYKKISSQFGAYPLIYDARENTIKGVSRSVVSSSTIQAIKNWNEWLLASKLVNPRYYVINSASGVKIMTDKPWFINFDPTRNNESQFFNFKAYLKFNQDSGVKIQDHIDVRFSEPGKNDLKKVYAK